MTNEAAEILKLFEAASPKGKALILALVQAFAEVFKSEPDRTEPA